MAQRATGTSSATGELCEAAGIKPSGAGFPARVTISIWGTGTWTVLLQRRFKSSDEYRTVKTYDETDVGEEDMDISALQDVRLYVSAVSGTVNGSIND